MDPSYVEDGSFNIVVDEHFGCLGWRLRHREYRLKQNPDQRPAAGLLMSLAGKWALAGKPFDAVFHYGGFHRITAE